MITITEDVLAIRITNGSISDNVLKTLIDNIHRNGDYVYVQFGDSEIKIDYKQVSSPVVASALALEAALEAMRINLPLSGFYATTGSFTNADLIDGIATFYLDGTDGLNSTQKVVVIFYPDGSSETVTATAGDHLGADPLTKFTYDFGGALAAGTHYWMAYCKKV